MKADQSQYIDNYYVRHLDEDQLRPALAGTTETDVCVIGGGLAGLNTALGLVERGKSVVLVEARRVGWGASGRNAGFVAKGYAAGEGALLSRLGLEKAQALVALTKNARKTIRRRIDAFGIDCAPVRDGVLTVSFKDKPDALKKYIDTANGNFDLGFEFWPREKVRAHCKTQKYMDGVYSPNDFQFNPLRYVRGLAREIEKRGGIIFENTPATRIYKEGAGWSVDTAEGKVRAQYVVFCCASYSRGLEPRLENASFPVQTYLMATAPIDESILKSAIDTPHAIYDTRFCSDFYRILPENRLLWGGRVGVWAHPSDIASAMMEDMFKLYPHLRGHVAPETAWSGYLCYAPHKMPQIGELEPGYWYNTGYGGHGLAPTTAGGEVVASAIAGGDKTYQRFAPFGISYAGGPLGRYAAQLVYLWWRARDFIDV